jgi:pimeloyl-ACP methyl ester carboxylesterase
LISKADSYDSIKNESEEFECNFQVYSSVWKDFEKLRRSNKLLKLGKKIKTPVVAIHGEYDPHPYKGIEKTFSNILTNFKFFLLEKCGHCPWIEKNARDNFYNILKKEIN